MARGSKVNIEEYLTSLEPFLKVGCSLHESCVNAYVPYTTMRDYYDGMHPESEEVRRKIDAWGNEDIRIARESVVFNMKEDGNLALKYLERKKRDEFSTTQQITSVVETHTEYMLRMNEDERR